MSSLKIGINHVSNKDYHADKTYLSSSNFKLLLKDREKFYKEKILGQVERKESSSFDEGSLTHSLILEPHQVENDYAFFNGLRKSGDDFERFKLSAGTKTVISRPQKIRCDAFVESFYKNKTAVNMLSNGAAEYTICQTLLDIPVKMRADYINIDDGFIADIKTSSYPTDVDTFRMTVTQWGYDLSAALYTMIAELHYGKPFQFYFVVIDKKNLVCEVYKASKETLDKGKLQVIESLKIYKECVKTGTWNNQVTVEDKLTKSTNYEILEV